ncbi:CRISPR-associated protein Csm3 [Ectothiorhodospira magna]|uniref:CRISPR system Cms endoribonuclease Csm3 n=1 Tax=Ectothiorhodospira magna TaxID=867345 RepID=A0A1H9GDC0_9GAMM|nr:type III-A CRISPR-associated RAMP protein Csm3 [Ectothiorhodospira magna]SEQ47778.1 CRISPR-associated protein Csm3 [Ectothiorhodospira magna]
MQLTHIGEIQGRIELISGLHIGSGNTEMHIGGTDNPVIKNPFTHEPYIPGSSIKGKMRSLMEWRAGVVSETQGKPLGFRHIRSLPENRVNAGRNILRLFGGAPEGASQEESLVTEIGPTRLAFWDCNLERDWVAEMQSKNLLLTETKSENMIDRIKGVAENPRNTERVPAGARFEFRLTLRVIDGEDLMEDILRGLRLLELTGLGGSGSRGYGKLRFTDLTWEGASLQERLAAVTV